MLIIFNHSIFFFLTFLHIFHYFHLYFPVLDATGNVCSGVEVSLTAVPNGCGCQPSETEPCTYDKDLQTDEARCFICDAADLIVSTIGGSEPCDECKSCLNACDGCVGANTTDTIDEMKACLSSNEMNEDNTDPECRESCSSVCTKL